MSNIDRADLEAVLACHGLSFAAVVTSEDVGAYKPSPQVFRRSLAMLGMRAGEVLHAGDSLSADVALSVCGDLQCLVCLLLAGAGGGSCQ